MKNITLILLFAMGLILSSCSKEDDPQPNCNDGGTPAVTQSNNS